MRVTRHAIAVTADNDGNAVAYSAEPVHGRVLQIRYIPDGTTPLATGSDVDITAEVSGAVVYDKDNIGTSAFTVVPRQATHGTDGTAALYAAGGAAVQDLVAVANERVKVAVAQGGAGGKGTFHVYVG